MNHVKHVLLAAMLMTSMLSLAAAEINPPFQQFATGSDFNLEGSTLSFSPNGMFESYSFCTEKQDGYVLFPAVINMTTCCPYAEAFESSPFSALGPSDPSSRPSL